ncbi:MAG: hypothetical protein JXO51_10950 [Candidatus Aminicenantes bacterium]|nr:hypothetical protein [Candidatus Aminicenantes bacterium]
MFNFMRTTATGRERTERALETRAKRRILVLSILLHVLLLTAWETAVRLDLARLMPVASVAEPSAPLVFDLQPPERPREVIATPEDARTTPEPRRPDFLSDKNALARNQEPSPVRKANDDPFSRGDIASHDLLPRTPPPEPPAEPEVAKPAGDESEAQRTAREENAEIRPETELRLPRETKPAAPQRPPLRLNLPVVPHRQLDSRADEDGGLSFNTYNWDFAPYMLALKERIGRNIFPPLAFTKLGIIDGDTLLRFRIHPDGRLTDLELLGYTGHRTLMETSRFAVTTSAPFPVLPADFPEPYLEVTAKFTYFIKR